MDRPPGPQEPTDQERSGDGPVHLRLEHLGVTFNTLTADDLLAILGRAVASRRRTIVSHHNLHSVFLCRRDAKLRRFHSSADFTHVDGMVLVFTARLVGLPIARAHRVTYADWIWPLAAESARQGWRVFHLGGAPGVADEAARRLCRRYPGLEMVSQHGFFDPRPDAAENLRVLRRIADFRPDVLMVGMGMPRQEHWILDNLDRLQVPVVLPCGACMDYVAEAASTPPRWAGRLGLEWLFRLLHEPRRLAGRYLVEPLFLIAPLAGELVRRRLLGRDRPTGGRGPST